MDLNEILAQMERMLRRVLGEDVGLSLLTYRGLGRVRTDAGRRDQFLQQRFDGWPDPMRKRFAPPDDPAVGLDLDQHRLERMTPLAGEYWLGSAKSELLAINDARYARDFHSNSNPSAARDSNFCWCA